jgi:hypothetical protein
VEAVVIAALGHLHPFPTKLDFDATLIHAFGPSRSQSGAASEASPSRRTRLVTLNLALRSRAGRARSDRVVSSDRRRRSWSRGRAAG